MSIQFTDICLITEDVIQLRSFYETVFQRKADGDKFHSSLNTGDIQFVFDYVNPLQESSAFQYVTAGGSKSIIIGFNVEDVDKEYQRLLESGIKMLNEPTTHPWGARSFQFTDTDGNVLNFRSFPGGD